MTTKHYGKRKHTPPCSSAELFLAEKNGVHRGKISVVDMVSWFLIGFLYPPPTWKVSLSGQKSSPKDFLSVVVVYAFFLSEQNTTESAQKCLFFSGKEAARRHIWQKTMAVAKCYGFERRTIFSTSGSFGFLQRPKPWPLCLSPDVSEVRQQGDMSGRHAQHLDMQLSEGA